MPVPTHIRRGRTHRLTAVMCLKKWLFPEAAACTGVLALLLLTCGNTAAQGVRDGISLCLASVIPALFPFFVAAQLLTSLGAAEALGRTAGPLFRRLFGIDGVGAAAFLLGLIGGYPVGAKATGSLVRQGLLSPEDGARLLTFCNNAGPAFILGIAGRGVFHSPRAGAWLYLLHAASATAVGLLLCRAGRTKPPAVPRTVLAGTRRSAVVPTKKPSASLAAAFIEAVQSGVRAMAGVCGFVIFFLVLLRLVEGALASLPPAAAGFLELTNGILRLTPDRRGFITAAGLLGWGGLSVHGQTAAVLGGSGISLRRYLPAKALQGALSAVLAAAVWRWVL